MIEQLVTETYKVSISLALLILAVLGLIYYIKQVDNRNMKITNERVSDLKDDIKELKKENKADKETLRTALDTFNRTTKEFQSINSTLSEMKTDITVIKEKIK